MGDIKGILFLQNYWNLRRKFILHTIAIFPIHYDPRPQTLQGCGLRAVWQYTSAGPGPLDVIGAYGLVTRLCLSLSAVKLYFFIIMGKISKLPPLLQSPYY